MAPWRALCFIAVYLATVCLHCTHAAHHIVYDGHYRLPGFDNTTLTRDIRIPLLGGVYVAGTGGTFLKDDGGGLYVQSAPNGGPNSTAGAVAPDPGSPSAYGPPGKAPDLVWYGPGTRMKDANWAVGDGANVWRSTGQDWVLGAGGPNAPARVSQPARVLYDPDSQPVLAPTSVAVGAQGLVMHHSGDYWRVRASSKTSYLRPATHLYGDGAGASDTAAVPLLGGQLAVGDNGAVYRRTGLGWQAVPISGSGMENVHWRAVALGDASMASVAVIVGDNGAAARLDPVTATLHDVSPTSLVVTATGELPDLLAVTIGVAASREAHGPEVWVAGTHGVVLVYLPRKSLWRSVPAANSGDALVLPRMVYHGITMRGTEVWLAGSLEGVGPTLAVATPNATADSLSTNAFGVAVVALNASLTSGSSATDTFLAIHSVGGTTGMVAVGTSGLAVRRWWNATANDGAGAWMWNRMVLPSHLSAHNTTIRGVLTTDAAVYAVGDHGLMITAPVGDDALAELQWQPWTHANGRRTPGAEDPTLNFTTISNVGGQTMLSAQPSRVWVWAWDGFRVVSDSTIDGSTLNAVQGLELCLIQGQEVPGSGVGGSAGFLVENTPWVQPAYDLYCGGSGRRDFRGYSAVTFYMKAIAGSGWSQDEVAGLTLTLSTWDKRTGSVPVANYTTSGQPINDQGWAHITVPFEDLAGGGDDWDLSNVEMLSWGGLDGGRYIIDEISVVDTPSEGQRPDIQSLPTLASLTAVTVLRNPVRASSTADGIPDDVLVPDVALACGEAAACGILDAVHQRWVHDPTPASVAADAAGITSSVVTTGLWSYVTDDGRHGGVWGVGTDGLVMRRDVFDLRAVAAAAGSATGVTDSELAMEAQHDVPAWALVEDLPATVAAADLTAVAGWQRGGGVLGGVIVVGGAGVAAIFVASDAAGVNGVWFPSATGVTTTLRGVTAFNAAAAYAVGDDGVVLKYANALASDAAATLDSAVSASSPEVEAAVASIGSTGTWSVVSVPSTASTSTLYGVHVLPGVESADVVVVGSAGLLMELERGSQSWTVKDTPTTKDLLSVHTGSPVHGYTAVGRDATILHRHYTGEWLSQVSEDELIDASVGTAGSDLHAVFGSQPCLFYAREAATAGRTGAAAIELRADHWHNAAVRLYCGGRGRVHMTSHNVLEFFMQRTAGTRAHPTLSVSTWNHASKTVPIAEYIVGSQAVRAEGISSAWQRVRIPLAELMTPTYLLWGVETITFGNNSIGCGADSGVFRSTHDACDTYLVDGLRLVDDAALGGSTLGPTSNHTRTPVNASLTSVTRPSSHPFTCGSTGQCAWFNADDGEWHPAQLPTDADILGLFSPPPAQATTPSSLTGGEAAVYVSDDVVAPSEQVWAVGRSGTVLHWPSLSVSTQAGATAWAKQDGWEAVSQATIHSSVDVHGVHGQLDTSGNVAQVLVCGSNASLGLITHTHQPPAAPVTTWTSYDVVNASLVQPHTVLRSVRVVRLVQDVRELSPEEASGRSPSAPPPLLPAVIADAVAVGDHGTILRYGGNGEERTWFVPPGVQSIVGVDIQAHTLFGVYAYTMDASFSGLPSYGDGARIYVCGSGGLLLLWDGLRWQEVSTPTAVDLLAVSGGGQQMVAVGRSGVILRRHWSGAWKQVHDGTSLRTGIGPWVTSAAATSQPHQQTPALADVEVPGTCLHYAQEVPGAGLNGGAAVELRGDAWHEPSMKLYCGSRPRQNLCRHDALELRIRVAPRRVGHTFPWVQLASWRESGQRVQLADWVVPNGTAPGVAPFDPVQGFDTEYRLVRIPLSALVGTPPTPTVPFSSFHASPYRWELWDVETLRFGNTSAGCARSSVQSSVFDAACQPIYIDDVRVVDATPYEEETSPRLCEIVHAARNGPLNTVTPLVSPTQATIRDMTTAPNVPCTTPRPMFMGPCHGDTEVWGVGTNGAIVYHAPLQDGWVELPSPTTQHLYGVAAMARDFVWAVGEDGIVVHNRHAPEAAAPEWVVEPSPTPGTTLRGLAAIDKGWMLAAGDGATVASYRNWVWTVYTGVAGVATSVRLHDVDGSPANGVVRPPWPEFAVAVGDDGVIAHWVDVATLPAGAAYSVGGAPGSTDTSVEYHTPGNHSAGTFVWTTVDSGVTADLYAVFVQNPFKAWACGAHGTALYYDGKAWAAFPVPTPRHLYGIGGFAANSVVMVGAAMTTINVHWTGSLVRAPWRHSKWEVVVGDSDAYTIVDPESGTSTSADADAYGGVFVDDGEATESAGGTATVGGRVLPDLYAVSSRGRCLEFATEVDGAGMGGGSAILLRPDHWHNPAIKLYCGTNYRRNFQPYDALQLFLRSSRPQASQGLLIGLGKWNRQSNILRVADYIEGGVIDTEWRRVFIPLNDLRTAEWSLGGSSTIHFHNTSAHCNFAFPASTHACDSFFVDDISVLDMTPPFIKSWVALSGDLFELEVNEPYDPVAVENPALFGLVSDTDPTYMNDTVLADSVGDASHTAAQLLAGSVPAAEVSMQYGFKGFAQGSLASEVTYRLYVRFPAPMKAGHTYTLLTAGIVDEADNEMRHHRITVRFDDRNMHNRNVKVNSQGYRPSFPKLGYFGGYASTMGGFAWGVGTFGRIWGYVPRLGRFVQFTTPAQHASTPTTSHLRSVAAIREDMALAVGDGGTAWLWRGAPHEPRFWHPSERVDSPWARHPSQAARRSINDTMWGSLSAHSTQQQGWVPMQVPDGARLANLTCVRFGRTGDAWAVGTGGVVLRLQYNTVQLAAGESVTTYAWEQLESPTSRSLRGVWVGPPTTMSSEHRVVIVGDAATHWTWRGDGSGGSLASGAPAEWDMSGSWTQTAVDVGTFRPGVNPSSVHFTAVTGPDGSFVGATHGLFLQLAYGSWRTVNDGMLHPNATVTSALVDVRRETLLTTDTGHVYHGFYGFSRFNDTTASFTHAKFSPATPQPSTATSAQALSVATAATLVTSKWCGFGGLPHREGCVTALFAGIHAQHVPVADTADAFAARPGSWRGVQPVGDDDAQGVAFTFPDTPHRPTLSNAGASPVILAMAGVPSGVQRLSSPAPRALVVRHSDTPQPTALVQRGQLEVQGVSSPPLSAEATGAADSTQSAQWCTGLGVPRAGWVDWLPCAGPLAGNTTYDAVTYDTAANLAAAAVGPRAGSLQAAVPALPPSFLTSTPQPATDRLDTQAWEVVAEVPLELRAANWKLSGEDVYMFNFTNVTRPGRYHVWLPGVGVSDTFAIGEDAWDFMAYTTGRGLYYQRCGYPLGHVEPAADAPFERPPCHSHLPSRLQPVKLHDGSESPGTSRRLQLAGGMHHAEHHHDHAPPPAVGTAALHAQLRASAKATKPLSELEVTVGADASLAGAAALAQRAAMRSLSTVTDPDAVTLESEFDAGDAELEDDTEQVREGGETGSTAISSSGLGLDAGVGQDGELGPGGIVAVAAAPKASDDDFDEDALSEFDIDPALYIYAEGSNSTDEFGAYEGFTDAVFHTSLPTQPLYNSEAPGSWKDVHAGWHDAGDYGKYIPSATSAMASQVLAYELVPEAFSDDQWNLPESGNSVPDILDELKWEADFVWRLQDRSDGGWYNKVCACTWYHGMPHEEPTARRIYAKSTKDTASGVAALAAASRVWAPYSYQVSRRYLLAAQRGWQFLVAHPSPEPSAGWQTPGFCDTSGFMGGEIDVGVRMWAATELMRATGNQTYRDYFEETYNSQFYVEGWQSIPGLHSAFTAYLLDTTAPSSTRSANVAARLLATMPIDAETTFGNAYMSGSRLDVLGWIGWGKFTIGPRHSLQLLAAYHLTGNRAFFDAALANIDSQLGNHPLGMTFVTGLAARTPRDPLSDVALSDGVVEPVPGVPVFGSYAHLDNAHPFYVLVQHDTNNFPYTKYTSDGTPVLRRYIDHKQIVPMSEYQIMEQAVTGAVHTIFANLAPQATTKLSVVSAQLEQYGRRLVLRMSRPHPRARGRVSDAPPTSRVGQAIGPSVPPTQPCRALFDASTITALDLAPEPSLEPACWWPDDMTLAVELGPSTSLLPGDNVTLAGPRVGYSVHTARKWLVNVPVAAVTTAQPPVLVLIAPSVVGRCDNVTVDASGSVGVAGMSGDEPQLVWALDSADIVEVGQNSSSAAMALAQGLSVEVVGLDAFFADAYQSATLRINASALGALTVVHGGASPYTGATVGELLDTHDNLALRLVVTGQGTTRVGGVGSANVTVLRVANIASVTRLSGLATDDGSVVQATLHEPSEGCSNTTTSRRRLVQQALPPAPLQPVWYQVTQHGYTVDAATALRLGLPPSSAHAANAVVGTALTVPSSALIPGLPYEFALGSASGGDAATPVATWQTSARPTHPVLAPMVHEHVHPSGLPLELQVQVVAAAGAGPVVDVQWQCFYWPHSVEPAAFTTPADQLAFARELAVGVGTGASALGVTMLFKEDNTAVLPVPCPHFSAQPVSGPVLRVSTHSTSGVMRSPGKYAFVANVTQRAGVWWVRGALQDTPAVTAATTFAAHTIMVLPTPAPLVTIVAPPSVAPEAGANTADVVPALSVQRPAVVVNANEPLELVGSALLAVDALTTASGVVGGALNVTSTNVEAVVVDAAAFDSLGAAAATDAMAAAVRAASQTGGRVSFQWSLVDGMFALPVSNTSSGGDSSYLPVSVLRQSTLRLPPNTLIPGSRYRFRLVATPADSSWAPAYADIMVAVNSPPSGGSLHASEATVDVGSNIELAARGWSDVEGHYPLVYTFHALVQPSVQGAAPAEKLLLPPQLSPTVLVSLPVGTTSVRVRVHDAFGATGTSATLNVAAAGVTGGAASQFTELLRVVDTAVMPRVHSATRLLDVGAALGACLAGMDALNEAARVVGGLAAAGVSGTTLESWHTARNALLAAVHNAVVVSGPTVVASAHPALAQLSTGQALAALACVSDSVAAAGIAQADAVQHAGQVIHSASMVLSQLVSRPRRDLASRVLAARRALLTATSFRSSQTNSTLSQAVFRHAAQAASDVSSILASPLVCGHDVQPTDHFAASAATTAGDWTVAARRLPVGTATAELSSPTHRGVATVTMVDDASSPTAPGTCVDVAVSFADLTSYSVAHIASNVTVSVHPGRMARSSTTRVVVLVPLNDAGQKSVRNGILPTCATSDVGLLASGSAEHCEPVQVVGGAATCNCTIPSGVVPAPCEPLACVEEWVQVAVLLPGSCNDGVQNGFESGVDCGGSSPCGACNCDTVSPPSFWDASQRRCMPCRPLCDVAASEVESVPCGGGWGPPSDRVCSSLAAECSDGVVGTTTAAAPMETGIDCGGMCSAKCPVGQGCETASDCASGVCGDTGLCMSSSGSCTSDCGGLACSARQHCGGAQCHQGYCVDAAVPQVRLALAIGGVSESYLQQAHVKRALRGAIASAAGVAPYRVLITGVAPDGAVATVTVLVLCTPVTAASVAAQLTAAASDSSGTTLEARVREIDAALAQSTVSFHNSPATVTGEPAPTTGDSGLSQAVVVVLIGLGAAAVVVAAAVVFWKLSRRGGHRAVTPEGKRPETPSPAVTSPGGTSWQYENPMKQT